ncbi:MAG TPA: hypothetical protein PKA82_12175 [Pyrinomonadaceae bacterium]|nr:hypothetical protein [Pyrinomonadaceae bacterium]
MTPKRQQNPSLVLASLGVCLGLVLVFASSASAQSNESKPDDYGIVINKRPMKVFAAEAGKAIQEGTVDLSSPVKFSLSANIVEQPKNSIVKLSNVRLLEGSSGDVAMKKLAIDGILALGDSGWFGYLYKFGATNIRIDVEQDGTNFSVRLACKMKDESEATATSNALAALMSIGKSTATGEVAALINAATSSSKETDLLLNLALPKDTFVKMLETSFGISSSVK